MVEAGGGQPPAAVDAVAVDDDALGHTLAGLADVEADPVALVGDLVVAEGDAVAVHAGVHAERVAAVDDEVQVRDVARAVRDVDLTQDRGAARAGAAGHHDRAPVLAALVAPQPAGEHRAGLEAAGLAGAEGVLQLLRRAERGAGGAGCAVAAVRRGELVARRRDLDHVDGCGRRWRGRRGRRGGGRRAPVLLGGRRSCEGSHPREAGRGEQKGGFHEHRPGPDGHAASFRWAWSTPGGGTAAATPSERHRAAPRTTTWGHRPGAPPGHAERVLRIAIRSGPRGSNLSGPGQYFGLRSV